MLGKFSNNVMFGKCLARKLVSVVDLEVFVETWLESTLNKEERKASTIRKTHEVQGFLWYYEGIIILTLTICDTVLYKDSEADCCSYNIISMSQKPRRRNRFCILIRSYNKTFMVAIPSLGKAGQIRECMHLYTFIVFARTRLLSTLSRFFWKVKFDCERDSKLRLTLPTKLSQPRKRRRIFRVKRLKIYCMDCLPNLP